MLMFKTCYLFLAQCHFQTFNKSCDVAVRWCVAWNRPDGSAWVPFACRPSPSLRPCPHFPPCSSTLLPPWRMLSLDKRFAHTLVTWLRIISEFHWHQKQLYSCLLSVWHTQTHTLSLSRFWLPFIKVALTSNEAAATSTKMNFNCPV